MDASKGIMIGVGLIITVLVASAMFMIYKSGNNLTNKGLSQVTDLTKNFDDIDKQKYDKMSLTGDSVLQVIQDYWDDPTCEVVVCTLDGINAVYNKESTDGTYTVPFNETLTGMPTADAKGRAFASDLSGQDTSHLTAVSGVTNDALASDKNKLFDVSAVANVNITNGAASGNAMIVDAARLVQNPSSTKLILATANGYNASAAVGSGGYISSTSAFTGSVQKDANGAIRRITFVQK